MDRTGSSSSGGSFGRCGRAGCPSRPAHSAGSPVALPSQEEAPTLTFELPTESTPKEAPPISFELPPEVAPLAEKKEESQAPSLEFSLPLPGEEPSPPPPPPTPSPAPSLEFAPAEFGIQAPPPPPTEEWVPTPPPTEALPIHELIYNAISARLLELAGEIARSVEFLMSQRPNITVDEVYLLGGGALLKDLDKFLQAHLGIPVVPLNPFRYMDVSPVTSRLGRDYVERMAPMYAVAIGLALWAYL